VNVTRAVEFLNVNPKDDARPLEMEMVKEPIGGEIKLYVPLTRTLLITMPLVRSPTSYCKTLVPAVHANTIEPSTATSALDTSTYFGPPFSHVVDDSAVACNKWRLEEAEGMTVIRM
jgi:hypothetical protein